MTAANIPRRPRAKKPYRNRINPVHETRLRYSVGKGESVSSSGVDFAIKTIYRRRLRRITAGKRKQLQGSTPKASQAGRSAQVRAQRKQHPARGRREKSTAEYPRLDLGLSYRGRYHSIFSNMSNLHQNSRLAGNGFGQEWKTSLLTHLNGFHWGRYETEIDDEGSHELTKQDMARTKGIYRGFYEVQSKRIAFETAQLLRGSTKINPEKSQSSKALHQTLSPNFSNYLRTFKINSEVMDRQRLFSPHPLSRRARYRGHIFHQDSEDGPGMFIGRTESYLPSDSCLLPFGVSGGSFQKPRDAIHAAEPNVDDHYSVTSTTISHPIIMNRKGKTQRSAWKTNQGRSKDWRDVNVTTLTGHTKAPRSKARWVLDDIHLTSPSDQSDCDSPKEKDAKPFNIRLPQPSPREPASQRQRRIDLPYESFMGSVLGGQYRLGRSIRQEVHADVYEVTPMLYSSNEQLEAKAYIIDGISRRLKDYRTRNMRSLRNRTVVTIDQAGKKWIVFKADPQYKCCVYTTGVQPSSRKENTDTPRGCRPLRHRDKTYAVSGSRYKVVPSCVTPERVSSTHEEGTMKLKNAPTSTKQAKKPANQEFWQRHAFPYDASIFDTYLDLANHIRTIRRQAERIVRKSRSPRRDSVKLPKRPGWRAPGADYSRWVARHAELLAITCLRDEYPVSTLMFLVKQAMKLKRIARMHEVLRCRWTVLIRILDEWRDFAIAIQEIDGRWSKAEDTNEHLVDLAWSLRKHPFRNSGFADARSVESPNRALDDSGSQPETLYAGYLQQRDRVLKLEKQWPRVLHEVRKGLWDDWVIDVDLFNTSSEMSILEKLEDRSGVSLDIKWPRCVFGRLQIGS
ncbi:hypothetical protein BJ170DRAFT_679883 [Xylariales sp. AK1849]|nr:hypothetical protein BJ170DRAFT_679883 [Xylariales sp. AK1849]